MPDAVRLYVSASRVASWVGPGAPHPDVLDALARATGAVALTADDYVVVHAGSLAAVLVLTHGEHPSRAEMRVALEEAWVVAGREAARRGLLEVSSPRFDVEMTLPPSGRGDRVAIVLAFNGGREAASAIAASAPGACLAAGEGADSFALHRLGDDPDAITRLLEAWRARGVPPANVTAASHPGNHPRVVALGFEVAGRTLLGPLDLLESGWPAVRDVV